MKKQFIAIGIAAVLALLGITALVSYARNADDRALEGTKLAAVLRVTQEVDAKTPASELGDKVETVKIPLTALVPGALTKISDVDGLVTRGVLVPGDQLTSSKFAKADTVKGDAAVPKGMQEVVIPLDGARIVGGSLAAGDRAGVFISYDGKTANPINGLLVLKVSGGVAGSDGAATSSMLTVAAKTLAAKEIINGMEFGKVWLSKQNADTETDSGKTITQKDVAP